MLGLNSVRRSLKPYGKALTVTLVHYGLRLVYPVGEAHATTFFTAGMNVFGLLIIELIKVIDLKARLDNPDSSKNDGLLWTGVFQGVLFLLGLVFLIGRV